MAATEDEAFDAIQAAQPELAFIDIELQTGTGFGLIDRLESSNLHVVFTTALDQRAINLLRLSGVPYIQKPIDLDSLSRTLQVAGDHSGRVAQLEALSQLRATLRNNRTPVSIHLPGCEQCSYVKLQDVVTIEACGKESRVWLQSGDAVLTTAELKDWDELLRDFGFFRLHQHFMVNRWQVHEIPAGERDVIGMKNSKQVPVSPKKLAELRQFLAS